MVDSIAPYGLALISLGLFVILAQSLSAVSAVARSKAGYGPGEVPPVNYADRVYRTCRAYQNSVDNIGPFAAAVAAAILAGAAPILVNLFSAVAILARLGFAYVYFQGIGPADQGPRSILYVVNSVMTIALAVIAILAVMF
ncbi:MAG: MAPEG family protein [Pseudomonadota bacterium]